MFWTEILSASLSVCRLAMPDRGKRYWAVLLVCLVVGGARAQSISTSVPEKVDPEEIYLFYLHGGIVQDQGANAVSEYYGKYEYQAILDTLSGRGFHVISEVRAKGVSEIDYAKKVRLQIDTLELLGVPIKNIVIVGASLGAYIALEVSLIKKDPGLRYVLLGLCSEYAVDYFSAGDRIFYGKYLSIYEKTDAKGSCRSLFEPGNGNLEFEEIRLTMGIAHAFLFKPYREWVDPVTEWIRRE